MRVRPAKTKEEKIKSINKSNFETMEKKEFRGEYLAPKVKVVEMQAKQQMLAGSGDIDRMNYGSDINGDDNF